MKKLSLILIVLISLAAANVGCQDTEQNLLNSNVQNQQFGRMDQLFKSELNLSKTQEEKWDEIHLKYRNKFVAIRQGPTLDRNKKREEIKSTAIEMDNEMLAILDDNQKETYKNIVKENRNKAKSNYNNRKNNKGGKPGNQSFIQMKNELNLSEKQLKQWDEIQKSYKPEFIEIRKTGQPGSEETRKEMIAMIEKKNAEILAMLDSDQRATYSKFVEERKQMAKQRQN